MPELKWTSFRKNTAVILYRMDEQFWLRVRMWSPWVLASLPGQNKKTSLAGGFFAETY
jgi:hypothetical protein